MPEIFTKPHSIHIPCTQNTQRSLCPHPLLSPFFALITLTSVGYLFNSVNRYLNIYSILRNNFSTRNKGEIRSTCSAQS